MAGLLPLDTGPAERREANEIVELFLTLGADLHVGRAKVAELLFAAASNGPAGKVATYPPGTRPNVRLAPAPGRAQVEFHFGS